jgi:hypothetical protein
MEVRKGDCLILYLFCLQGCVFLPARSTRTRALAADRKTAPHHVVQAAGSVNPPRLSWLAIA